MSREFLTISVQCTHVPHTPKAIPMQQIVKYLSLAIWSVNFIPSKKKKKSSCEYDFCHGIKNCARKDNSIKIDFFILYLCEFHAVRYSFSSYLVSHSFSVKAGFLPFVRPWPPFFPSAWVITHLTHFFRGEVVRRNGTREETRMCERARKNIYSFPRT